MRLVAQHDRVGKTPKTICFGGDLRVLNANIQTTRVRQKRVHFKNIHYVFESSLKNVPNYCAAFVGHVIVAVFRSTKHDSFVLSGDTNEVVYILTREWHRTNFWRQYRARLKSCARYDK